MLWIEKLKHAFGIGAPERMTKDIPAGGMRKIVANHCHGNVRLTQAKYYTKKDVEERFERLKDISFSDR